MSVYLLSIHCVQVKIVGPSVMLYSCSCWIVPCAGHSINQAACLYLQPVAGFRRPTCFVQLKRKIRKESGGTFAAVITAILHFVHTASGSITGAVAEFPTQSMADLSAEPSLISQHGHGSVNFSLLLQHSQEH